jgi:glycine cleavage system H protein
MSQPSDVKEDRRYTKEHEWAQVKNGQVVIGISAFAIDQLGDITLVNWDVSVGDRVEPGQVFGTIESVKTLSDLFAPIAGTVTKINTQLETTPELVNEDGWEKGWMVVIDPTDLDALGDLMDAAAYRQHIASLEH